MATVDDYDFTKGESGASETYPCEAGQIKKGGYMMIKGHPCKILSISVSKTGKHGHAKCNFTATDIFTNKKLEDMVPSTHGVMVPNVDRTEYSLLDIDDEQFCSLLTDSGDSKDDLKLPGAPHDDLAREIQAKFDEGVSLIVTVMTACGHEQIMSWKEDTN